jgi:hypothetical protein
LFVEQLLRVVTGKNEAPLLQAFRRQDEAAAIPGQQLQRVAMTIHEHEQRRTQRILGASRAHHADQSIKALSHVSRFAIGQDPAWYRREQHR